jgi:hypothetical protein
MPSVPPPTAAPSPPSTRSAPPPLPSRRRPPGPASVNRPGDVHLVPAARAVAAWLHRAQRDNRLTTPDMWAIGIFGSVAAVALIALLVMILRALFVF